MSDRQLRRGSMVILAELPSGLLRGLPNSDQQAIRDIVGKPVKLSDYDENGRAELEFMDQDGGTHFIYVDPGLIRPC